MQTGSNRRNFGIHTNLVGTGGNLACFAAVFSHPNKATWNGDVQDSYL